MIAVVPLALLLGCGFATGRRGVAALVVLLAVMVATVVGVAVDRRYQRRDWRGAARALGPARFDRALVFSPGFSNPGPFGVYYGPVRVLLGGAPRVRVREVAVVALAVKHGSGPHPPTVPAGAPPPPPRGFLLAEDRRTSSYRLVRFTAPGPRTLDAPALASLALPGTRPALVLQRGRGAAP